MGNRSCFCNAVDNIRDSIRGCFCPNRLSDRFDDRNRGCCCRNRGLSPFSDNDNNRNCNNGCGCGRRNRGDFDRDDRFDRNDDDRQLAETIFDCSRNGRFRPRTDRRFF